jgi:hypothetical protein
MNSGEHMPTTSDLAEYDKVMQTEEQNKELTLVPDPGRDIHAELRAQAVVEGLVPPAPLQAKDESPDGIMEDVINAEMERINALAPEQSTPPALAEVVLQPEPQLSAWEAAQARKGITPESPAEQTPPDMMAFIAERNARIAKAKEQFSLDPKDRFKNFVGGVVEKANKMKAQRAEDARLASRSPVEVLNDHYDAMDRWAKNATESAPATLAVATNPAEKPPRPVPLVRETAPKIPPPGGPVERKARQTWGMEGVGTQKTFRNPSEGKRDFDVEEQELLKALHNIRAQKEAQRKREKEEKASLFNQERSHAERIAQAERLLKELTKLLAELRADEEGIPPQPPSRVANTRQAA